MSLNTSLKNMGLIPLTQYMSTFIQYAILVSHQNKNYNSIILTTELEQIGLNHL